jgi:hypothetical protein
MLLGSILSDEITFKTIFGALTGAKLLIQRVPEPYLAVNLSNQRVPAAYRAVNLLNQRVPEPYRAMNLLD